jgi:hypothetical protein
MTLQRAAFPALVAIAAALAGCGGGDNPLDNPPTVQNPAGSGGRKLSFVYFQECVNPVLLARITSSGGTSTCASAGCHSNVSGTGGALRVVPGASLPVAVSGVDAAALRETDMYKNFYSSQGVTVIGQPTQSRLLKKPLVQGVLHGGGLIFDSDQDTFVKRMAYWISRPVPEGDPNEEFSESAAASMFTQTDPANPQTRTCNAD